MDSYPDKSRSQALCAWVGAVWAAVLVVLVVARPPDGSTHAPIAQFLGRFHPLLIHLPIGLVLLVGVLEAAECIGRWPHLGKAIGFILGLGTAAALLAATDGWLLGWSGGYGGHEVIVHMWAGTILSVILVIALGLHAASATKKGLLSLYRATLVISIGLLAWTGHEGGGLSHGEGFITEFMPGPLRTLFRVPAPKPKPAPAQTAPATTLYAVRIAPIFDRSCVSCHGPKKVKGGLRMDTYALLMKGGEDGAAVEPWYPQKSELIRRVSLPPDDDDAMPSGGKKRLSPEEIQLLEKWIASGASETEPDDVVPH